MRIAIFGGFCFSYKPTKSNPRRKKKPYNVNRVLGSNLEVSCFTDDAEVGRWGYPIHEGPDPSLLRGHSPFSAAHRSQNYPSQQRRRSWRWKRKIKKKKKEKRFSCVVRSWRVFSKAIQSILSLTLCCSKGKKAVFRDFANQKLSRKISSQGVPSYLVHSFIYTCLWVTKGLHC